VEGHHVLPQCIEKKEMSNINNIVFLTAREHFICHWLATKMFHGVNRHRMIHAFTLLTKSNSFMRRIGCSRQFEAAKIRYREQMTQLGALNRGVTHSDQTKRLLADRQRGRKASAETKLKMAMRKRGKFNIMYGQHHTAATRTKISAATMGRTAHNKGKLADPEHVAKMKETKRNKAQQFEVYNNQAMLVGVMSISEFCERYTYNYYSAYGSIKQKGVFFDWKFILRQELVLTP
jgi:hypothetical protein